MEEREKLCSEDYEWEGREKKVRRGEERGDMRALSPDQDCLYKKFK